MRRQPWFELHDHPRFPGFLRDQITDALEATWNGLGSYRGAAPLLESAIRRSRAARVIDLCSGGGGPWPTLAPLLGEVPVVLTDKFPNHVAFARLAAAVPNIQGVPGPVDAAHLPAELRGFRTIFSSFHHFAPDLASAILRDAARAGDGIGIFEMAQPRLSTMALVVFVPLTTLLFTPMIRPFRWSRLLFTYLLPVIPLVLFVDGLLSCLRSYSEADLRELAEAVDAPGYSWEAGCKRGRVASILFLVGTPS